MARTLWTKLPAPEHRCLYAAFAALILANLLFSPDESVTPPALATQESNACCVLASEVAVGSNNGSCTFQGLCNFNATAAANCTNSSLSGQTPCNQVTGQTGFIDAYCQSGGSGNCQTATTSSRKHLWSGQCCAITISGPDGDGNYSCVCPCCTVWGGLSTDPPIQYQQCTVGSSQC